MRLEHDSEADAIYVYLSDAPVGYSTILDDARNLDYSADGQVIGVELLNVSRGVDLRDIPYQAEIGHLLEEHNIKVFA